MLVRFKVSNHLSFKDEITLSMIKGRTTGLENHIKHTTETDLLRTSAIYGKNGAGKSNLVKSLSTMRGMVIGGPSPGINTYYRPDESNMNKDSVFEVEIETNGKYYSYGFTMLISKQKIKDEWLYELSSVNGNKYIFRRNGRRIEHHFPSDKTGLIDVLMNLLKDNKLFITLVGQVVPDDNASLNEVKNIFRWFSDKLIIMDTHYPFIPANSFTDEGLDEINKVMSSIDIGVNRIDYERNDDVSKNIPNDLSSMIMNDLAEKRRSCAALRRNDVVSYSTVKDYRVSLSEKGDLIFDEIIYKHGGTVFHSEEESDGTRKMYGIIAMFLSEEQGITFVMDELDSRIHPDLTLFIVKYFSEIASKKDYQFVFTTHADTIMEKNILRRDEIWFIEKGTSGYSDLYSLEDFREKTERRIRKAYREGRYGAVPMISYNPVGE